MTLPVTAPKWKNKINAALNGEASAELRNLASLATRRKFGAFFTGSTLSRRLVKMSRARAQSLTYDPTCGMGDLLVATARTLPLGKTLNETLLQWGKRLAGTDLHPEFITGTKTRLVLLARQRHASKSAPPVVSIDQLFPHIRVADGLSTTAEYRSAERVLMNPPFGHKRAPAGCKWAEGKVSRAAEFIVHALEQMEAGAELLAILPDVLRSGTFSAKWRDRISDLAEVHFVQTCGLFDESADIDVFLVRLVRRFSTDKTHLRRWPRPRRASSQRLEDHFEVAVGRVVPHRDAENGLTHPYIHPRGVPPWKTMRKFSEYRRHFAEPFSAPFVVIRRTSRPEHPHRATGSIIGGKAKVAVENHLIVCTPKDGTFRSCLQLLAQLKKKRVNQTLNKRIRCRHLTVGAVREIPFTPYRSPSKARR